MKGRGHFNFFIMGNINNKVNDAKAWWKSKTIIGTIMMLLPTIIRMIDPSLVLDVEAGSDAVFEQAGEIANQADLIIGQGKLLWATIAESLGVILTAIGLRTAKQPLK